MNPSETLTVAPTTDFVIHHGAECRVWRGVNSEGRAVTLLVSLVIEEGGGGSRWCAWPGPNP